MANIHERYLSQLFYSNISVYTGGELVNLLCEKFPDCSRENARKIIETSVRKSIMKSSKPVTFGHKQYAYYANHNKLTIENIKVILEKTRPSLGRIINRLSTSGVISYSEILKLAATTVTPTKSKVTSLSQIVQIIDGLDIAQPKTNWGNHYLVNKLFDEGQAIQAMQEKHEEIKLDAIFIPMFIGWLKKHNIVTTSHALYRSKNTPHDGIIHNNLAWDAVAYTSSTGYFEFIGSDLEETQTCVLLDVKISAPYSIDDLMGFYDRIQLYRNSVLHDKKRKVLPIIVANDAEFGVKTKIQNLKMLYFNLGTVFGERIYEIINNMKLIKLNDYQNEDLTERIEGSLKALVESGQQDNLSNLKGELFERLMFSVLNKIFRFSDIKHSYIYNFTTEDGKRQSYEYDYLVETQEEFIVFELKGYKGSTYIKKGDFDKDKNKPTPNSVKWFFGWAYPKIKEKLKGNPFNKPVRGCYITTARFYDDAREVLEKVNCSNDKPNTMDCFYDGDKLLKLLKKYQLDNEIHVLEKYYEPVLPPESESLNLHRRSGDNDFPNSNARTYAINSLEELEEFF